MQLALIPGHGNRYRKGGHVYDPGATRGSVVEAEWVRALAERIVELAPPGTVRIFDEPRLGGPLSTYTRRRGEAHDWLTRGLVVHLHCNAGGGRYSLAMYDPRSSVGAKVAKVLAGILAREAPILTAQAKCRVMAAARPDWAHAANLLEPTYSEPAGVCAVLFEWAFVDQPGAEALYRDSLDEVARAFVALI
jgi:hypothetical protein